jgi:hypothetical protein
MVSGHASGQPVKVSMSPTMCVPVPRAAAKGTSARPYPVQHIAAAPATANRFPARPAIRSASAAEAKPAARITNRTIRPGQSWRYRQASRAVPVNAAIPAREWVP